VHGAWRVCALSIPRLEGSLSFAKTPQGHDSRPVTMLQARPHAVHFKRILDFGEGQGMWGSHGGEILSP
jgi:hypothetical protein